GRPHAELRWADAEHLEYELAVTRPSVTFSRTFVGRRQWDPRANRFHVTGPWEEAPDTMAGNEPLQLHGDVEVMAAPGPEQMPCAIAILRRGEAEAQRRAQPAARLRHDRVVRREPGRVLAADDRPPVTPGTHLAGRSAEACMST